MADKKVSELTQADALDGTELAHVVQGGNSRRTSILAIKDGAGARVDVASATTTNIGAAASQYVRITGTTTIEAFDDVPAGVTREVLFDASVTIEHDATSLIMPGGKDIVTTAGDVAVFRSEGSGNWRCVRYSPVGISPETVVNGTAKAWINFDGTGTNNRASFNVSSRTNNGTGDYTVNFVNAMVDEFYSFTSGSNRAGTANGDVQLCYRNGLTKTSSALRIEALGTGTTVLVNAVENYLAVYR